MAPTKSGLTSPFTSFDALASSDNQISSALVAGANELPGPCWMLFNLQNEMRTRGINAVYLPAHIRHRKKEV